MSFFFVPYRHPTTVLLCTQRTWHCSMVAGNVWRSLLPGQRRSPAPRVRLGPKNTTSLHDTLRRQGNRTTRATNAIRFV